MKRELTPTDIDRLNAARGLDMQGRTVAGRSNQNMDGLKPSVEDYNKAIKSGVYSGQYITPIGSDETADIDDII